MTWYAVYHQTTKALISSGSSVAKDLPSGWAVVEFTDRPGSGFDWNPATLKFDLPRAPIAPPVSSIDFMRRFTQTERAAIRRLSKRDDIAEDFFDLLKVTPTLQVTDPDVIGGVHYLASKGVLDTARIAEILSIEG